MNIYSALGVEALGGCLVSAMIAGSVLNLSIGAWDNAKKWIANNREEGDNMEVA